MRDLLPPYGCSAKHDPMLHPPKAEKEESEQSIGSAHAVLP